MRPWEMIHAEIKHTPINEVDARIDTLLDQSRNEVAVLNETIRRLEEMQSYLRGVPVVDQTLTVIPVSAPRLAITSPAPISTAATTIPLNPPSTRSSAAQAVGAALGIKADETSAKVAASA